MGKVVVVEGDGGLLMGFSALSTIGRLKPKKLILLVLDNGTYAATGGQPTGAEATDFAAVSREPAASMDAMSTATTWRRRSKRQSAPTDRCCCGSGSTRRNRRTGYFLADPVVLGHAFQAYVKQLAE